MNDDQFEDRITRWLDYLSIIVIALCTLLLVVLVAFGIIDLIAYARTVL